jgi:hypothetical protein
MNEVQVDTVETRYRATATPRQLHHEIYLGDPRRSAPERLRTLIRQSPAG